MLRLALCLAASRSRERAIEQQAGRGVNCFAFIWFSVLTFFGILLFCHVNLADLLDLLVVRFTLPLLGTVQWPI